MGKTGRAAAAASDICAAYDVCDACLGRMFAKELRLRAARPLGARLRPAPMPGGAKCYVCRGLLDKMGQVCDMAAESANKYEFSTFQAGLTMRPSVLDRDDFVRSKFQLAGADSIKRAVSRELVRGISRRCRARHEAGRPEAIITVSLKDESAAITTRPVIVSGRYTKSRRGLPQKLPACAKCGGSGCAVCKDRSVESLVSACLQKLFGASGVRTMWIGGEDPDSLVSGRGRPFYSQVLCPKARRPALPKKTDAGCAVCITGLRQIGALPASPPKFRSQIAISVQADRPVNDAALRRLRTIAKSPVAVYDRGRRAEKSVYSVRYRRAGPGSFVLRISADGGLPVKKFVAGETVFPNLSDLLEAPCRCVHFDFEGVEPA